MVVVVLRAEELARRDPGTAARKERCWEHNPAVQISDLRLHGGKPASATGAFPRWQGLGLLAAPTSLGHGQADALACPASRRAFTLLQRTRCPPCPPCPLLAQSTACELRASCPSGARAAKRICVGGRVPGSCASSDAALCALAPVGARVNCEQ